MWTCSGFKARGPTLKAWPAPPDATINEGYSGE